MTDTTMANKLATQRELAAPDAEQGQVWARSAYFERVFGLSEYLLQSLVKKGKVRCLKFGEGGGAVIYSVTDTNRFIEQNAATGEKSLSTARMAV